MQKVNKIQMSQPKENPHIIITSYEYIILLNVHEHVFSFHSEVIDSQNKINTAQPSFVHIILYSERFLYGWKSHKSGRKSL